MKMTLAILNHPFLQTLTLFRLYTLVKCDHVLSLITEQYFPCIDVCIIPLKVSTLQSNM